MTTVTGRLPDGAPARLVVDDARITAVEPVPDAESLPWILPGLVDLQVNGYAGLDVNADELAPDVVHELVRALWKRGVTTVLPTVITAAPEKMHAAVHTIARARAEDPLTRHSVPGVHLEGPYLSAEDGPRGAHDAAHIRPPDVAELDQWMDAAADAFLLVTLAPETAGAVDYIRAATARGVLAAVGHTAASPEQIHAAADAGARLSTHLGNGCHAVLPRHPNHIWAQLADTRLAASFVADGHHLPADTFTAMVRAVGPERAVMVSDSVTLAGCAPGDYSTPVGGAVTLHPDGRLTLAGSSLLAGAAASLADCLAWAVHGAGHELPAVVAMASENPARLAGLKARGRLEVGGAADLTVLSSDLASVRTTVVRGTVVHDAGT